MSSAGLRAGLSLGKVIKHERYKIDFTKIATFDDLKTVLEAIGSQLEFNRAVMLHIDSETREKYFKLWP